AGGRTGSERANPAGDSGGGRSPGDCGAGSACFHRCEHTFVAGTRGDCDWRWRDGRRRPYASRVVRFQRPRPGPEANSADCACLGRRKRTTIVSPPRLVLRCCAIIKKNDISATTGWGGSPVSERQPERRWVGVRL